MNLDDLEPGSPEYEAALDAAQADEDAANGNTEGAEANSDPDEGDEQDEGAGAAVVADDRTKPDSETPAAPAAASPEKPSNPSGVMSKDGKTVLPFAVVQSARQERARERDARLAAEAELASARKEIEDLRAGRKPAVEDADPLETALAEAIEEIPALAAVATAMKAQREELAALKAKPATTTQEPEAESEDPVQAAIDAVPALATWQATDPEKFRRAQQLDVAISESRKWAGKPMSERFAHVARLVAEEFDIQVEDEPAPQRTTNNPNRANPQDVIRNAARAAPNTLSDMKGGAAATSEDRLDRMPVQKLLGRMEAMTDDEIDAHLAKFG